MILRTNLCQMILWISSNWLRMFTPQIEHWIAPWIIYIHIPKIKTVSYGNHSIRHHCARLWKQMFRNGTRRIHSHQVNDIKLCQVNSVHYFKKKKLKQHFLYEYSLQWLNCLIGTTLIILFNIFILWCTNTQSNFFFIHREFFASLIPYLFF